jgi:hypothetical protein
MRAFEGYFSKPHIKESGSKPTFLFLVLAPISEIQQVYNKSKSRDSTSSRAK